MTIICFHNPNEENGELSNWWKSKFILDGVSFTSVEQWMMYRKAITFGDQTTALKILATDDVRKIKALGREVRNYDDRVWSSVRYSEVRRGVEAKIRYSEHIQSLLKSYPKDSVFCECAKNDRIWGIGLTMHDPRRLNPRLWEGENLLGQIWTEMRNLYN